METTIKEWVAVQLTDGDVSVHDLAVRYCRAKSSFGPAAVDKAKFKMIVNDMVASGVLMAYKEGSHRFLTCWGTGQTEETKQVPVTKPRVEQDAGDYQTHIQRSLLEQMLGHLPIRTPQAIIEKPRVQPEQSRLSRSSDRQSSEEKTHVTDGSTIDWQTRIQAGMDAAFPLLPLRAAAAIQKCVEYIVEPNHLGTLRRALIRSTFDRTTTIKCYSVNRCPRILALPTDHYDSIVNVLLRVTQLTTDTNDEWFYD
jgi:hypothetical protein